MESKFPFGAAVERCRPVAQSQRRLFVLGAYPSAFHVRWRSPEGKSIRALAVENEPEPFWNGSDEQLHLERWKQSVKFDERRHGVAKPAGELNGSSGRWLDEKILAPLGCVRDDAWITDCLDTYRCSDGVAARIADTFAKFAREAGLPEVQLLPHPSEDDIVREASAPQQRQRLEDELRAAAPELVVTLGNAALRVMRDLVKCEADAVPEKLSPEGYGRAFEVTFEGRALLWRPLAHPAAPQAYQRAHAALVSAGLR